MGSLFPPIQIQVQMAGEDSGSDPIQLGEPESNQEEESFPSALAMGQEPTIPPPPASDAPRFSPPPSANINSPEDMLEIDPATGRRILPEQRRVGRIGVTRGIRTTSRNRLVRF